MTHSMTAFASRTGLSDSASWVWEIRGVNARGLDLRLRLPEGLAALDARLRALLSERLSRGNITVSLRLTPGGTEPGLSVDEAQLDAVLMALDQIQHRAMTQGITLAQPTSADVLAQRGVMRQAMDQTPEEIAALAELLLEDFRPLLDSFCTMRASEGAALEKVIADQITEIAALTSQAAEAARARRPQVQANLTAALGRVMQDAGDFDEQRIAQELALLAVKSDITEEIDRLGSHVDAARTLLAQDGPKGRKLDFLMQEFNREANTLCSKSQDTALTGIGLNLKAVIDQMREQIQNVE